jgi:thiosulfate reductase cytochrome b subunit
MSGLQIFNAFPHLHWGSKAEPGEALVSIWATNQHGHVRGYIGFLGHRIDTTGLLGVQLTESGPTVRAFPSWITIPGYFWLAGGRRWHFFGWLFATNGLLYFIYNLLNGHMRKFVFTPRDAAKVPAMILYYLHLRREAPQDGEYNPLQKMAYTSVFVIQMFSDVFRTSIRRAQSLLYERSRSRFSPVSSTRARPGRAIRSSMSRQ